CELREEGLPDLAPARHRAKDIETDDVPRALPDRVERRLAIEARHHRLLDVAVPAEALERFRREHRGALADPVLDDRGREAGEVAVALVVGGTREAPPRRGRGPRLRGGGGGHVLHARLVDPPA